MSVARSRQRLFLKWILCQDVEGHSPIGGFGREH